MHNDIKRQNVLVQRAQHRLKAYVTDFGISRYLGCDYQEYLNSFTSQIRGTFFYIAPECFKKNDDGKYPKATFKSDIWALGALLAELFLEDELYDDLTEMMVCKTIGEMPSSFSRIPVAFQDILKRCLGVKPPERPTANELLVFFQSGEYFEDNASSSESSSLPNTPAPSGFSRTTSSQDSSSLFFENLALQGTSKEPNTPQPKYEMDSPVSELSSSVRLSDSHVQPDVKDLHDSAFWEDLKELKQDVTCKRKPEVLSKKQGVSHDKINLTFDWQKGVLACHFLIIL